MVTQGVSVAHLIHYPESDGQPRAETEIHGDIIEDIKYKLTQHYRNEPLVHVGGNLLLYYVEGDPTQSASPDVYVTFGMDKEPRRTYKLWAERRAPTVIFEITSESSKYKDLGTKKGLYEALGVREYFLIDPLGEYLDPPLRGFRLDEHGQYQSIEGPELESMALGLRLGWHQGRVSLKVIESGEVLLSAAEQSFRAAQEAIRAAQAEEKAEQEAIRAKQAEEKAEHAEEKAEQEAIRANQAEEKAEHAEEKAEQEAIRAEQAEEKIRQEQAAREATERRLRDLEARLAALENKG